MCNAANPDARMPACPARRGSLHGSSRPAPRRYARKPAAAGRAVFAGRAAGAAACRLLAAFAAMGICLLPHAASAASSPEQRFAEAQAMFDAAKRTMEKAGADSVDARRGFHEAATRFAAIARDGVTSANLCVNAGNAYHFAGDEPRALLWYLRALRLANTPDIRNGVATLRRACRAELWPAEAGSIGRVLMAWHYDVSRPTKQRVLLAAYPLGCVLVIASRFVRRRSLCLRLGLVLMCVGAAMGVSDILTAVSPPERWAVVVEGGKGYAGDGEGYSVVIEGLKPGQEVKLIERRPEWVRVALPGGATCWVRAGNCEEV